MNEWSGMMWIKKGSRHFIGVQAHPQKVHVWGALCQDGILGINIFTGNLNAPKLVAILKESLIKDANKLYGKGEWSLAHDNDPKHTAKKTTNFLKRQKVNFKQLYSYKRFTLSGGLHVVQILIQ